MSDLDKRGLTYQFPVFKLAGGSCPEGYITLPGPAKWDANLKHYVPCSMQEIIEASNESSR